MALLNFDLEKSAIKLTALKELVLSRHFVFIILTLQSFIRLISKFQAFVIFSIEFLLSCKHIWVCLHFSNSNFSFTVSIVKVFSSTTLNLLFSHQKVLTARRGFQTLLQALSDLFGSGCFILTNVTQLFLYLVVGHEKCVQVYEIGHGDFETGVRENTIYFEEIQKM